MKFSQSRISFLHTRIKRLFESCKQSEAPRRFMKKTKHCNLFWVKMLF